MSHEYTGSQRVLSNVPIVYCANRGNASTSRSGNEKLEGADTAVCQRQTQTQRQETKTQRQEHRQTKQHRKWKLAFLRKGLTCPQGVTRLAVENTPI